MNNKQKLILKIVAVIVLAMILFPPFHLHLQNGAIINLGYGFLFSPPKKSDYMGSVDTGLLLVQWISVVLVFGVLWWLAKDKT